MVSFLKTVLIHVSTSSESIFKFNYHIHVCVENHSLKTIEISIKWYYDGIYAHSFSSSKLGKGRSINRIYIPLFLTKISLSEERNQTNIVYICDKNLMTRY